MAAPVDLGGNDQGLDLARRHVLAMRNSALGLRVGGAGACDDRSREHSSSTVRKISLGASRLSAESSNEITLQKLGLFVVHPFCLQSLRAAISLLLAFPYSS